MVEITTQTYLTFFTQNKTHTQHLNFHKCSIEQLRAHTCIYVVLILLLVCALAGKVELQG